MSVRKKSAPRTVPTLARLRPTLLRITKERGVKNVRVFGSFVRGGQNQRSDVDLLVDLPDHFSLFDLSGLKIELEEALHRKVDVLTEDSISHYIKDQVLQEAKPL